MTHRFLLFAFDDYYPRGGLDDFQQAFHEIKDAHHYIDTYKRYDNIQIFDTKTKFVYRSFPEFIEKCEP